MKDDNFWVVVIIVIIVIICFYSLTTKNMNSTYYNSGNSNYKMNPAYNSGGHDYKTNQMYNKYGNNYKTNQMYNKGVYDYRMNPMYNKMGSKHYNEEQNYGEKNNYKWVTSGLCSTHGLSPLNADECKDYFKEPNYTVTGAKHGPPGCWPFLGDKLTKLGREMPQFKGKAFVCHSTVNDGIQCSTDNPCVCK